MKKILSLFVVFALTVLLTACVKAPNFTGSSGTDLNSGNGSSPQRSVGRRDTNLPSSQPATGDSPSGSSGNQGTEFLEKDQVKTIVLNHAGLTDVSLRRIETDLDRDLGITVYEVEFEYGGYDYEYILHAISGEILFHEKEPERD